jgi:hypothetical protein
MKRTILVLFVIAALAGPSCDNDPSPGTADTAVGDTGGDVTGGDAAGGDAAGGDAGSTGGKCGPSLSCEAGQACQSLGQGACVGPAPDENGQCAPGCSPTECGGSMHCLCTSYSCIDLPAGWTGCDYEWTDWHQSCICDDSTGMVTLDCPGA